MKPTKPIAFILLSLALALPLHAGKADGNQKAASSGSKAVFKKKDKDHDGFLTKDEFTTGAKDASKAGAVFEKKDKNNDSKLSSAEFIGKSSGRSAKDGKAKRSNKARKGGKSKKGGKSGRGGKSGGGKGGRNNR